MPAPATADAFLEIVRKSNQIDEARLDAYLSSQSPAGLPDHKRLAASLVRAGIITTFQAEQFLRGKHKGFSIAGYRVVERVGTGGTGTVYLGEHQVMKRRVAIKVLPAALASDPATQQRFRREAQAAGLLDHPNVIHVYDYREENGLPALVMEYVEGPNLQEVIARGGPQPIGAACEYARQAALGLQHAHEKGLVHRDVKPANLLLDSSGLIKLLDLGLARYEVAGEESLTQMFNSKMVMGTADYLAPEQAMSLHDVDGRADIYALGATLFALVAGKAPFHEGSIGQKLLWHQTRVPDRLDKVRPDVPAGLADLVARMLAKTPEERPATCAEVAAALEAWAGPVVPGAERRPASETPVPDTIRTQAVETARIPKETPAAPAGRPFLWAGAFAAAAGLIGGVVAVLLMGLRG